MGNSAYKEPLLENDNSRKFEQFPSRKRTKLESNHQKENIHKSTSNTDKTKCVKCFGLCIHQGKMPSTTLKKPLNDAIFSKSDPKLDKRLPQFYRKIPEEFKLKYPHLSNKVLRQISGSGGCLYGCLAQLLYGNEHDYKFIRRRLHAFLKESYSAMVKHDLILEHNLKFPMDLIIAGKSDRTRINSIQEWLEYLQSDISLNTYSESEVEMLNICNGLGININIFCYNKRTKGYWWNLKPNPSIYNLSPLKGDWNLPDKNVYLMHEINSHFEVLVEDPRK